MGVGEHDLFQVHVSNLPISSKPAGMNERFSVCFLPLILSLLLFFEWWDFSLLSANYSSSVYSLFMFKYVNFLTLYVFLCVCVCVCVCACTTVFFFLKKLIHLFSKDAIPVLTVKTVMLKTFSISFKYWSFELSIHQRIEASVALFGHAL